VHSCGTAQPVKGIGRVKCTSTIDLSSVLHVPAFPVNLVSLSALDHQLDCRVLDRTMCLIQEKPKGRKLGTGIRHRGLWYMDRGVLEPKVMAVFAEDKVTKARHVL